MQCSDNYEALSTEEILALFHSKDYCLDLNKVKLQFFLQFNKERELVDYLIDNLPGAEFVIGKIINYIISNKLIVVDGNEATQEKLDKFLLAENESGNNNKRVFIGAIRESLLHREAGLRLLSEEQGLLLYKREDFIALYENPRKRIRKLIGYLVSDLEGVGVTETEFNGLDFTVENDDGSITDPIRNITLIPSDNFSVLNLFTSDTNIALKQKLTIQLLLSILIRANFDVTYDGPGRFVIKMDPQEVMNHYGDPTETDVMKNRQQAFDRARAEAKKVALEMKNSGSDNLILLNKVLSEFIHLPRVHKVTEFKEIMSKDDEIVPKLFSMPPNMFDGGSFSGNISREHEINNFMSTQVVAIRENIIRPVSNMLAKGLGISSEIAFDIYKPLATAGDDERKLTNMARSIHWLVQAGETEKAKEIAERM